MDAEDVLDAAELYFDARRELRACTTQCAYEADYFCAEQYDRCDEALKEFDAKLRAYIKARIQEFLSAGEED